MTSSPFSARGIDLSRARLVPLDPACCPSLAQAIVAIPPWSMMPYPADAMARFLAASADGAYRYLVEGGGKPAGAVSIRHPWLKGPYLELLALLPPWQSQGIGAEILAWFEQEGLRADARNLWVCASSSTSAPCASINGTASGRPHRCPGSWPMATTRSCCGNSRSEASSYCAFAASPAGAGVAPVMSSSMPGTTSTNRAPPSMEASSPPFSS